MHTGGFHNEVTESAHYACVLCAVALLILGAGCAKNVAPERNSRRSRRIRPATPTRSMSWSISPCIAIPASMPHATGPRRPGPGGSGQGPIPAAGPVQRGGAVLRQRLNYKASVYDIASLNVPLTGSYNFVNSLGFAQIIATSGKRTSGLKQAKMLALITKLDVIRRQDCVAFGVASFYHLVGLTNDIDAILEDATRRIMVFQKVAHELNRLGSLRTSELDYLQADYWCRNSSSFAWPRRPAGTRPTRR